MTWDHPTIARSQTAVNGNFCKCIIVSGTVQSWLKMLKHVSARNCQGYQHRYSQAFIREDIRMDGSLRSLGGFCWERKQEPIRRREGDGHGLCCSQGDNPACHGQALQSKNWSSKDPLRDLKCQQVLSQLRAMVGSATGQLCAACGWPYSAMRKSRDCARDSDNLVRSDAERNRLSSHVIFFNTTKKPKEQDKMT